MYAERQNRERVSRRIESASSGTKQRVKTIQFGTTIQREKWVKVQNAQNLQMWDTIKDGLSWFYDEKTKKMLYEIKEKSDISEEHLEWYEYFKGQKKTYKEWCQIFKGDLKIYAARDASKHTVGNYKSRNAVISILTKYGLLEECLKDDWKIQSVQNSARVLEDFKKTYEIMTNSPISTDVNIVDLFEDYLEQSIPIIKGFKQLGAGDDKLVNTIVNRGDSESILDSMGLSSIKNMKEGKNDYNKEVKFLGVTSTNIGDNYLENQYARNSTVVWILTIGEKHHGFNFKEIANEGYGSENEITFPMGVSANITSVEVCKEKVRYIIRGTIY